MFELTQAINNSAWLRTSHSFGYSQQLNMAQNQPLCWLQVLLLALNVQTKYLYTHPHCKPEMTINWRRPKLSQLQFF